MPVAGFHRGDRVLTPNGTRGTVASVARIAGRERVYVRVEPYGDERCYYASSLRRDHRTAQA